jgi:protoporphyrin/coproporphyrin ferrochelatase
VYDAVLVVSFGGPEGPDDVLPFLENVTRGRNVPPARLVEVAKQYHLFGGVSPINGQNRALTAALAEELARRGPDIPVYWGNRNWHPLLADTLRTMAGDGIRRAAAFVTSAYSSYSSCRQYLEDVERARKEVGERAPIVDKVRAFFNHPGFIDPQAARLGEALAGLPGATRATCRLLFTAHSIPVAMAETSDYVRQLAETSRLVVERVPDAPPWELVFQSRSGPPTQPWLGPDMQERLPALAADGVTDVVVVPIGFVSDHMEVVYDLDTQAKSVASAAGLGWTRVPTVGTDPAFVAMIRDLVVERWDQPDAPCSAAGCCLPPARPPSGR